MFSGKYSYLFCIGLIVLLDPMDARSEGEILEFFCQSCGYKAQFVQGFSAEEQTRNIQHVIVVCERAGQIKNIKIPLNPDVRSKGSRSWRGNMGQVTRRCSASGSRDFSFRQHVPAIPHNSVP